MGYLCQNLKCLPAQGKPPLQSLPQTSVPVTYNGEFVWLKKWEEGGITSALKKSQGVARQEIRFAFPKKDLCLTPGNGMPRLIRLSLALSGAPSVSPSVR